MPIPEPNDLELYWAAGFLEGEGSFCLSDGYLNVNAGQKEREPLERLQAVLGGRINGPGKQRIYRWYVARQVEAEALMGLLYPLMSTRRQVQIEAALRNRVIRGRPGANHRKTHCPKGHPYDVEDVLNGKFRRRRCSLCYREAMARARAKTKERYQTDPRYRKRYREYQQAWRAKHE